MLRWRKLAIVVRREYLSRVKTKAFWISTLLVPVLIAAFAILPSVLINTTGGAYVVAVMTTDKALLADVERILAATEAEDTGIVGKLTITLRQVEPTPNAVAQRTELKREVLAKQLNAVVVLPARILADGKAEYISTNVSAIRLMSRLERVVGDAVMHRRLIN